MTSHQRGSPKWWLERMVARLTESDDGLAKIFFPKQFKGGPHETKAQFMRNLFANLYAQQPEPYTSVRGVKIGNRSSYTEKDFFAQLRKMTYFQELREETVRHLATSAEVLRTIADGAWSAYWSHQDEKDHEFLEEDGDLSPEDRLRAATRRMAEQGKQTAEEFGEIEQMFLGAGMFPSENETRLPDKNAQALLHQMKSCRYLKGLIELLGRTQETAKRAMANSVRRGTKIPHNYDLGNDLARVLPAEMAAKRRMRLLWLAQFAEGGLLQDGLGEEENQAEGDIFILCDESGSMTTNMRNQWAKAIAAAAWLTCQPAGRKVYYYPFGSSLGEPKTNIGDILNSFANYGSTDIPKVISELTARLKAPKAEWDLGSMDILVISDDVSPDFGKGKNSEIAMDFMDVKKKHGMRVLGIKLGHTLALNREGHVDPVSTLGAISDKFISTGDNPAEDFAKAKEAFEWLA